ncbi:hypothetical protein Tco_0087518 [Tanacetum coccineum]
MNSSSYQFKLDKQKFEIDVELFHEILCVCPRVPNKEFVAPPPYDSLVTFLKLIDLPRSLLTTFSQNITPFPRDTTHLSTISRMMVFLGKLKFVSKGEPTQVYAMSILDVMINDDIKKSKAYQKYLSISSGIITSKKTRKRMKATATPTKKGSITTEENIIFDPNEALQLGESMSLTEAEIAIEEQRLHETHASLVIGREQASEVDNEAGSDEDEVIISSDDERTESEREEAVSEKANDKGMKDDDEMHDKEDECDDDDEVHSSEVHDEENHDDDKIADKEETNDERTEYDVNDQEIAVAEKVDTGSQKRRKLIMSKQEMTKLKMIKLKILKQGILSL